MTPSTPQGRIDADAKCILLVIGYFAFQTLWRTVIGGALGLDEAEILVDAQAFRLGYGPQLPLYAWMQKLVFAVTGETVFGLALLKNMLLCGVFLVTYRLLRTAFDVRDAALATASLFLLPQIAWESQRALTHSVLVSLSCVLCFAIVWRLGRRPAGTGFVLFGLVLAVGGLSKYNFVVMPIAVILAAIGLAPLRANLLKLPLAGSFLLAGVLLVAPYLWIVRNPELALASSYKFGMTPEDIANPLDGLAAVAGAIVNLLALPFGIAAVLMLFFRRRDLPPAPPLLLEVLMRRTMIAAVIAVAAGTMLAGATEVKDRWLQPVLMLAVPALVLWMLPRLTDGGRRVLAGSCMAIAVVVPVALPFNYLKSGANVAGRFDATVPALTGQSSGETVFFGSPYVVGNLLHVAPDRVARKLVGRPTVPPEAPAALMWLGSDVSQGRERLAAAFSDAENWHLENHRVSEAPYRFGGGTFALSVARIVRD